VWSPSIRPTTLSFAPPVPDGKNAKLKRNSSAGLRRALIDIVSMTTLGVALRERIMRGHSVSPTVCAPHATLIGYINETFSSLKITSVTTEHLYRLLQKIC